MKNPRKSLGFTLIEVMIVVGVIGILASIAYPSYLESTRKTKRAEGRAELNQLIAAQEIFKQQNGTYRAFSLNEQNIPFKTYTGSLNKPSFLVSAQACPGQTIRDCVQLVAIPQYGDSKITQLRITSTDVKDCTGTDTSVCWK
jgi:type IV pilus assembly protein PilE